MSLFKFWHYQARCFLSFYSEINTSSTCTCICLVYYAASDMNRASEVTMLASIILSLALASLLSCHAEPTKGLKCMSMELPMCVLTLNGFPYNNTVSAMQQRNNIDDSNALINVLFMLHYLFVCQTHFLFCSADAKILLLLPCRSVCEVVFDNCIKYIALKLFQFSSSSSTLHQTIMLHAIFNLTNNFISPRTINSSFYFKPFYITVLHQDYITNTCTYIFTIYKHSH